MRHATMTSFMAGIASSALSLGMLAATPASAQDASAPVPPEKFLTSPGGVDMRTGQLLYTHTDLSIGDEKGLQLTRHFSPVTPGTFTRGKMGGFTHNWDIRANEKRIKVASAPYPSEYDYQVSISGPRTQTYRATWPLSEGDFAKSSDGIFTWLDFEYVIVNGSAEPSRYTYRATDGRRIEFRPNRTVANGGDGCGNSKCAFASELSEADGTVYSLSYNRYSSTTAPRLRSVVSNRGYALLFEYGPPGTNGDGLVTKACALNLAHTTMPSIAAEAICPSGVPTSTYSYDASGLLIGFTDQSGIFTSMGPDGSRLYKAGESTPYVTNTIVKAGYETYVTAQSFADGRSYTYSWTRDGNTVSSIMGGSYTDNNGKTVTAQYGKYRRGTYDPTWYVTKGPELVTDEIGRSTAYFYNCSGTAYCSPSEVRRVTQPEGNKLFFTYGSYGNITERRQTPKVYGLADIVTTSTFPSTSGSGCTFNCNKPLSTTDGRSNTTDYTYDPVHGGLLTETGPAVNGIRPQKRFSYAQRYAWIRNSAGGYSRAATPVWLLVREASCKTGAASANGCAIAGDEVATEYDYGPDAGPNNLLLRGKVVDPGGLNLRTCYTYDAQGNKIAETAPKAGLTSCQ